MLRFADELLLLPIDDKRGDLLPVPAWSLWCALAGAVLMELALENRIHTDPERVVLLDSTPLDDDLLDPVLAEITRSDASRPARFWVARFAEQGEYIIKRAYLETLRLHSTVPLTMRTVANSFEFAGCTVPAGHPVVVAFTLPHHMPAYFPSPERFDIDRFAPPRNEHQQPGVYMPYGLGTHCRLGSNLAEFMTTTAMAAALHDVELALVPPNYVLTERRVRRIPTRHPGRSFRFRLVRRRSAADEARAAVLTSHGSGE